MTTFFAKIKQPKIILTMVILGIIGLTSLWIISGNRLGNQLMTSQPTEESLKVVVSILPQTEIVERIGGNHVTVRALIPAGYSPATFEPTPQEIKFVSQADVYFRIGQIGFEKTKLESIVSVNPDMVVVDTSENNHYRQLEAHSHDEETDEQHAETDHVGEPHSEENKHAEEDQQNQVTSAADLDHAESELDPHVWLAPPMVLEQAQIVTETLAELDPAHSAEYQANFEALKTDLQQLDLSLRTAFSPIRGKTMLVYHPAFGYLADEYGFHQEHFQFEGKEPTIEQLKTVIELAREENIKVIFVQKQFSTESAQAIAEQIDGLVIEVDPLAPNYLENMQSIADTISQHLR